ncbi:MAG: S49 family peptidase [Rhizobacter sp.]
MKLLDILTSPWAIQPEKLMEIHAIYATHLRGDKIDIAAVEQRLGRPLANEPKRYEIYAGVAVLPIEGVVAKRANLFSQISGGVSTEMVARDLADAVNDPAVHSIILHIDSPGGTVDGTQSLASAITAAKALKPTVSLASGTMASAAYWFGSAAQAVYIEDTTTQVGSIGVVGAHVDISGAEAARGVKTTEISAGKYKRIASQYAPLSAEGRQTLQDQIDYTYSLFVNAVAVNRGVSEDKVLSDMADGRVFIGQQAIDAGLVDGVSTLAALVAQLNQERAGAAQPKPTSKGSAMSLTREQLAAQEPALLSAVLAEGATAERARIQAVESALIPGHEALIASMKFDGKSSGGDAALAVNAAERAARAHAATALANEAPKPVPSAAAPSVEPRADAQEADMSKPVDERCKAKWESDSKVRAEFGSLAAYTALTRAEEAGKVKVLGKRAG